MEFDKAVRLAVILSWEELQKTFESGSVRVEYQREAGTSLDYLSVWSDRPKGYQFLICNFSTTSLLANPSGAHFANGYHSDQLAQTLGLIMKNQNQFTRPVNAGQSGLILVGAPTGEDRAEATAWMSGVSSGAVAKETPVLAGH